MHWACVLMFLILQAPGGGRQPVLPPSVGPQLERIMSRQQLAASLGEGWEFGDVAITADSITIQVLHREKPAAVITLGRPPAGEDIAAGNWFTHRVEIPGGTASRSALLEIAGELDRGFESSPWRQPEFDPQNPRPFRESQEVPCSFCQPVTRWWPWHYTRLPGLPLALGALVAAALGLGVFFGLRRSGALKGILG